MSALLSPPILFFVLGLFATTLRTGLRVPHPIPKLLSLYLLFAIGFKGGVGLRESGLTVEVASTLTVAVALSLVVPLWAFFVLRRRLAVADAGAIAATYGSVSAVTFITAAAVLQEHAIPYSGHMVAAMALMESPAIVLAVVLIRWFDRARDEAGSGAGAARIAWGPLLHESFLNGPVFLLLGSMLVGLITGSKGAAALKPFAADAFTGVLCFFLLDLGLVAARRIRDLREGGVFCVAFALIAPVLNAGLGAAAAWALGLPTGDAFLLIVLAGSASYLAVPATMRLVVPEATPSLFVPMALGITFPFNVTIAIPLYLTLLERWWG